MQLTPSQQRAKQQLLRAVRAGAPLIELRSPIKSRSRGHGVTTVLAAVAQELGCSVLGVANTLDASQAQDSPAARLFGLALAQLAASGIAIVDDLDLAVAPRSISRSRTLVESLQGTSSVYQWGADATVPRVLKGLADAAAAAATAVDNGHAPHCIIFSTTEDSHEPFLQPPFVVSLGAPKAHDYAFIFRGVPGGADVDADAVYSLHGELSAAELRAAVVRSTTNAPLAPPDAMEEEAPPGGLTPPPTTTTESVLRAVRDELMATSAVEASDVERVELSEYPGMEEIHERLEKEVLFPFEHPREAARLGLTPKRGVLIHGSFGTGKTTVGRWLAHRLKGKFFLVREMMLHADIMRVFEAARAAAPAVVFIDDADIILGGWKPMHGASDIFRFLLSSMDGLTSRGSEGHGQVLTMLTAQDVRFLAPMLLRSGRIELWLKTKVPEGKRKRQILNKYIADDPGALELLGTTDGAPPKLDEVLPVCDGFSCADLRRIVNDAKVHAAYDRTPTLKSSGGHAAKKGADAEGDGAAYLLKAARYMRDMQDGVDETRRQMYT